MRIDDITYNNISVEVIQEVIRSNPNQFVEIIDKICSLGRNLPSFEYILKLIPRENHADLAKYYIKKQKIKEIAENLYLLKNLDLEIGLELATSRKDEVTGYLLNNIESFEKTNHEEIALAFIKVHKGKKFFSYFSSSPSTLKNFYFEDFNKFILKVLDLGEFRAVAFEVLQFFSIENLDLEIAKNLLKSGDKDVKKITLRKLNSDKSPFKIIDKNKPEEGLDNYTINEITKYPHLISSLC